MSKKIAILGGTFDPIHFGHLRAAQEIYEELTLDEIRLIPCKHPPHRSTPLASAADRLAMVRLAARGTKLIVDDREIDRPGPSYTVDTLVSLRDELPHASLNLMVGVDAFLGLPHWHNWKKIIQLANIIVMHRHGWNIPTTGIIPELLENHKLDSSKKITEYLHGKIIQLGITSLEITATTIRSLIQTGHSPDFLLPNSVMEYIQHHRLYTTPSSYPTTQPTEVS
jgi:nicotinate-nucleotide adenylyltransferase